jgi:hypothetical protein
MRTAVLALSLLLAATASAAPSAQTINIQGVLRDSAGSLQSMAVGLVVSVYAAPTGGSAFYSQNFTTVPVDNGFFNVELAGPLLSFAGLDDAWVGIQVSGDPTELPRQHLGAVPFAFTAANVSGVVPIEHGGTGSTTQTFVDLTSDQAAIGGNKTFTGLVNAARGVDGTPLRVCSGATPTGATAWTVYNTNGITLNVDTSGCGFKNAPHYISSLTCTTNCWTAAGGSNVYSPRPDGFTIYISDAGITPDRANMFNYHIEWIAVGN